MMGKQQALDGDICICKCTPSPVMLSSQDTAWHEFESHELAADSFGGTGKSMTSEYRGAFDERVRVIDANAPPAIWHPLPHSHR